MPIEFRELTPDLWPGLEDLFEDVAPAAACWCMFWRVGVDYRRRDASDNRDAFRAIVEGGESPGVVAVDAGRVVGWCQVTPKEAIPEVDRHRSTRNDSPTGTWAISCFVVAKDHRRQGLTTKLIDAAVAMAQRHGATAVEAYPIDGSVSPSATSTGYLSTYEHAGFDVVSRPRPSRAIVRLTLDQS